MAIDCIDDQSDWHGRAVERLQACSEQAPLHVNLMIYTELLISRPDVAALDALLDVYERFDRRCRGRAPR